jgi:hypothetical protein
MALLFLLILGSTPPVHLKRACADKVTISFTLLRKCWLPVNCLQLFTLVKLRYKVLIKYNLDRLIALEMVDFSKGPILFLDMVKGLNHPRAYDAHQVSLWDQLIYLAQIGGVYKIDILWRVLLVVHL